MSLIDKSVLMEFQHKQSTFDDTLPGFKQELTRALVDQSSSGRCIGYPWVLEQVLGDQMPFLASTSCGLGKRC